MADQFFMTQKGYDEAVERLKYLQTTKRQEIIERISEARSHGDLSENAEYDAARNEQSANEGEIVELDYKIKNAQIIEENDDTSFVHIGSTVKVYDTRRVRNLRADGHHGIGCDEQQNFQRIPRGRGALEA